MTQKKWARFKKKVNNYLFDHTGARIALDSAYTLILAALSSFTYAFGYSCFVQGISDASPSFVTGGVTGITQALVALLGVLKINPFSEQTMQSILYFAINVPLVIFAFRKVGIKFGIFTLIDVGLSSLLLRLFDLEGSFTHEIAKNAFVNGNMVLRSLLAGVLIGFSSAIAFKGFFSAGGLDIVSYHLSVKRSANAGKITLVLNIFVITFYFVINLIKNSNDWANAVMSILFSCLYLVIVSIVIDLVNTRNKKVQLQIVTTNENLCDTLIANFPHGITIVNGQGGYSKKDKIILFTTVSSQEVKKVIKVIAASDPHAFVDIYPVTRVVGSFYIKPIE